MITLWFLLGLLGRENATPPVVPLVTVNAVWRVPVITAEWPVTVRTGSWRAPVVPGRWARPVVPGLWREAA